MFNRFSLSPNKSQTAFITVIKNVMPSKESFSRVCNGEFLAVHDGFFCRCGAETKFPSLEAKVSRVDSSCEPAVQVFRLGKSFRRERAKRRAARESRRRAL
jgi:hypothetical protein